MPDDDKSLCVRKLRVDVRLTEREMQILANLAAYYGESLSATMRRCYKEIAHAKHITSTTPEANHHG